ncbi:putative zinc finger, CCHC-type containing protein [Tanacetum coccineum]|uniref:Zinc finger, CCHC-type containing protein n=1 Tax=Tanacetum coccineum TaxID=301880 RepID=A0ABQ5DGK1_9ASTR
MTSLPIYAIWPFQDQLQYAKEEMENERTDCHVYARREHLKVEKPDLVKVATTKSNKRKGSWKGKGLCGDNSTPNKVQKTGVSTSSFQGGPKCKFCHKKGHTQKDCLKFKEWLAKKGVFESFMINESFNINVPINSWWIDSGSMNSTCLGLRKKYRLNLKNDMPPQDKIVKTRHAEFLENANNNGSGSFRRIELHEARDKTPIIHVPIPINTPLDTSNDNLIVQDHPNNVEENEPNPEINVEPQETQQPLREKFQSNPGLHHWKASKKVLRYLQGTIEYKLTYTGSENLEVIGYSDSDFTKCKDTSRSTSGYIFMLLGRPISWKSKKQVLTTTSTMMVEPLKIYCDYSAAMSFSNSNSSTRAGLYLDTKRMYLNISRILELFCDELQKLITCFIPIVSLQLPIQHVSDGSR